MAVTIKDIAKRAGVSYSTVSRALNGIGAENTERQEEHTAPWLRRWGMCPTRPPST